MKSNMNHSFHAGVQGDVQSNSAKLASLLALAAGAVALPQTSHADIIYTDRTSNPGVVGPAGDSLFSFDLPGTATFGFQRLPAVGYTQPGSLTVNYFMVLAGQLDESVPTGGVVVNPSPGVVTRAFPYGAAWDGNGGQDIEIDAPVGIVGEFSFITPRPATGYDNQYLAWFFHDTTVNELRYGWAKISLSMDSYAAGGPTVTIWGYAYDNTGALPTMGQGIPEPSSGALLVMGAMALGARGLRKWRQSRLPLNPA